MNRREFTKNIATLILQMITDGNEPVIDYLLRSTEEQQRLFAKGVTKCDGIKKISQHQKALAADIYFVVDGKVDFSYFKTAELAIKYHDLWVTMGGRTMISWDKPHYE